MTTPNRTLKERAYRELKEYLVITIYLWLIFGLFLLHKAVILNEEHIDVLAKGFALINALALGKIMLIARALHLGDRFNNMPLIYTALIKSALFTVVLAFFKILEEAGRGSLPREIFPGEYGRSRWGHPNGNPYACTASVRNACPLLRIHRTAKSSR